MDGYISWPFPPLWEGILVMKIPIVHAQGSLWLTERYMCPQGLVAGWVHVSRLHAMLARGHVCCPAGSSGSAFCYCRTSLLSQAALFYPKTDQEQQRRLFQSFPLVLEQSSSVGEEGLVHNTIRDMLLWWFPEPGGHHLSTHWLICFSHLSGRRISSCCKRSECTIAAEDHPGTAGSGKESFRTWRRACGGN